MPLVLDDQFTEAWLDPTNNQKHVKELTGVGFTTQPFKVHPGSNSRYKHDADNHTLDILEPVAPIDLELDESQPSLF